jgi:Holliday junction resolvase-like predicted endonuclease
MPNFQGMGPKQGEAFEKSSVVALEAHGFTVLGRKVKMTDIGIEIDIVAENKHGVTMRFECKGSLQGDRPGAKRTDTLKKAICDAYLFTLSAEYECCSPLMFFMSHVPQGGQGLAMLQSVPRSTVYDVLNPWDDSKRLRWLYQATPEELEDDMHDQTITDILTDRWRVCGDRHYETKLHPA